MGRFGCMMRWAVLDNAIGPFWTTFLEIKILGAVLVGAVLAMGRFGIDPSTMVTDIEKLSEIRSRSGSPPKVNKLSRLVDAICNHITSSFDEIG